MNTKEYEAVLINHDWTYQMSDDSSVYRQGSKSMDKVRKHRNDSPKHSELFLKHYKKVEM